MSENSNTKSKKEGIECEYCKKIYKDEKNLKIHQRNAKFCIKIQSTFNKNTIKEEENTIKEEENTIKDKCREQVSEILSISVNIVDQKEEEESWPSFKLNGTITNNFIREVVNALTELAICINREDQMLIIKSEDGSPKLITAQEFIKLTLMVSREQITRLLQKVEKYQMMLYRLRFIKEKEFNDMKKEINKIERDIYYTNGTSDLIKRMATEYVNVCRSITLE